jgi:hypothetical protein
LLEIRLERSGLHKRMIDQTQTREFKQFCIQVQRADEHCPELLSRARQAQQTIQALEQNHEKLVEGMTGVARTYPEKEVDALRGGHGMSQTFVKQLATNTLMSTNYIYQTANHQVPPWPITINSVFFRYALCCQLYVVLKLSQGSNPTAKKKLRNQFIDLNHIAYATFFDGILSFETEVNDMYRLVRRLTSLFQK